MKAPPKRKWATRVRAAKDRIRALRRPIYVFALSLFATGFFAFTFTISRRFEEKRHNLSSYWFEQGQEELDEGKPQNAVPDLRAAVFYSHQNPRYVFNLARALAAADRVPEARSYFLNLLDEEPGGAPVTRDLARLAFGVTGGSKAGRYSASAIQGEWNGGPVLNGHKVGRDR